MQITTSKMDGRVPVHVLQLDGNLDASNYTNVIAKAHEIYDGGGRNLLIDLSKVPYVSSAGLMAIHTVSLIFAGQSIQSGTSGRPTFRSLDPERDQAAREHVKLLNPQQTVSEVLEMVGLKEFFQVFTDMESAVNSY